MTMVATHGKAQSAAEGLAEVLARAAREMGLRYVQTSECGCGVRYWVQQAIPHEASADTFSRN